MIGSSQMRLSGLMSGLDTDTLVKDLMSAERIPFDKLKQDREKQLWKSEMYRQWNTEIYTFRSSTLFDMKLSKSYGTYNVSSGKTDKATGVATSDALEGTHTLKINALALSASFKGTTKIDAAKALEAQDTTSVPPYRKLNSDASLTVSVTDASGTVRTAAVKIDSGDNIKAAVNAFNSAKDAEGESLGLQAYFDENLQQFILKTKETGQSTKITMTADNQASREAFYVLGLTANTDTATIPNSFDTSTAAGTIAQAGQNANIEFNGTTITNLTSNTVNLLGVNYTLKDVDTTGFAITVTRDLDKEVENIKNFISKYNDLLDKLNKAVNEPVYRDYQPLTDEERESLSEKQVEQWETRAKSGLLRRDSILSGIVNDMRLHATSVVNNGSEYNSLSAIGIASTSYEDRGKLTINEDKLREVLQKDPEAVKNLFMQDPADAGAGDRGIIQVLHEDFENAFERLIDKAGVSTSSPGDESVIGELIQDYEDRIERFENRLLDRENFYYKKFTALEKALSQFDAQSGWLAQQFGGGA